MAVIKPNGFRSYFAEMLLGLEVFLKFPGIRDINNKQHVFRFETDIDQTQIPTILCPKLSEDATPGWHDAASMERAKEGSSLKKKNTRNILNIARGQK